VSGKDLPYLSGTPLDQTSEQNPDWTLLDYAAVDGRFTWAWLENAGQLAYVVYPSASDSIVFPDGARIDSDPDNIVLQFLGDHDQRLEFLRFGGATFTLTGADIEVRYSVGEADAGEDVFVGNISVEADTIEIDLTTEIDGDLDLLAHDHLGVYGFIDLNDNQLSAYANSNVITGRILSADGVLNVCETDFETLPPNINIGTPLGQKNCHGDFVPSGTDTTSPIIEPAKNLPAAPAATSKSKGGHTGGLILGLLAWIILFRRRRQ